MNYINWGNLGGLPFTQNRMKFLQDGYMDAFSALAKLCGDKTILYGVTNTAGVVSDGWISYGGELLPFIGGAISTNVVITEVPQPFTFGNNNIYDVQFTRVASLAIAGGFLFSDLVQLSEFRNVWMPGDLKLKYVDAAYEAANFDANGFGINREKGWRVFSKQVPAAAGKALVNKAPGDADFGVVGNVANGSKTHTLTIGQMPKHKIKIKTGGDSALDNNAGGKPLGRQNDDGRVGDYESEEIGNDEAFNIIQPSFVILTLIKQ